MDLFAPNIAAMRSLAPLAERVRPSTLAGFVGQEHLLGPGKPLRVLIEHDELPSLIFWGPPGSGKTTLLNMIGALDSRPTLTTMSWGPPATVSSMVN